MRHPFLLSLERFEVVDGQLIIVTELADMSLKDRFEQARESDLGHIPRDELLGYMRDAADALDYMNENFSLQHLDVKPENLLLVGNRVKVADFGLVKQLQDVTASLMGGLTPIYASPEVFDGRASQRSDQYSLAIVYQEMLTGALPFPGKTPAQLAAQHLHARPRLTTLPSSDQAVIGRALSKDPDQRFPSCRAMVDALMGADKPATGPPSAADGRQKACGNSTSDTTPIRSRTDNTDHDWQRSSSGNARKGAPSPNVKTLVFGEASADGPGNSGIADSKPFEDDGNPLLPPAAPVEAAIDLPPLEFTSTADPLRPTLFVGLGGTATRMLSRLRRHMHDRLGPATSLPAMQMLLLDTDARSLYEATQGSCDAALRDAETVALPLRNAHDYAADQVKKLHWLSRRWLYNIPRSLRTEGRRPLGRLALVDHADQVFARLRQVLVAITSAESIVATEQATGTTFASHVPRVFVVSSISGGTGSGMVLDVAFAIRTILAELGLSDEGVCGILTHATDRNPTASDLSIANAYACLSELYHYSRSDFQHENVACGLPSSAALEGAFPHAYLVHLGDNLNDDQFEQSIDSLASYLYLNTMTPAAATFDECRKQTPSSPDRVSLRSFGLVRIGSMQTALPGLATELLCKEVVDLWRGNSREVVARAVPSSLVAMATQHDMQSGPSVPSEFEQQAADHAKGLKLDVEQLSQDVHLLVERQIGGSAESAFSELRAAINPSQEGQLVEYVQQMLSAINNFFGPTSPPEPPAKPAPTPLELALEGQLKQLAGPFGTAIGNWLLSLIDCPGPRVARAARAKQWYESYLRNMEAQIVEELRQQQQESAALEDALHSVAQTARHRRRMFFASRGTDANLELDSGLARLVRMRSEQATGRAMTKVIRLILAAIATASDQIADFQREMSRLGQEFADASPWDGALEAVSTLPVINEIRTMITESLQRQLPRLVHAVDTGLQANFLEPAGGLCGLLQRADTNRSALLAALCAQARSGIVQVLKETPIGDTLLKCSAVSSDHSQRLRDCIEAAQPKLNRCGGSQRLLAIAPDSSADLALREALTRDTDPPATVLLDSDANLVLCYEVQELWVPHVAARLIGDRGDLVKIALRLHTRNDIEWCELSRAVEPMGAPCASR